MKFRLLFCFFLLCGLSSPSFAQKITRGPYLQMGSPTAMTIVWRTDKSSDARIWYGTAPNALNFGVQRSSTAKQHELRITGLKPDTVYYYAVGTRSQILSKGTTSLRFRTHPTVGTAKPFRFWVVGDSGTGGTKQKQVRDAMLRYTRNAPVDLYLHMGDMAYTFGFDGDFQKKFFDIYQSILQNTVVWPTIGNHEGYTSSSSRQSGPYYDAYVLPTKAQSGGVASGTEAYYSFDYANVHFIVLDSNGTDRKPSGAMLKWLKKDLASTRQRWLVAYWHHPPYTKGSHDSDTENKLIEMRKYALPILEAAGVDLVLAGHSHIYERSWLVNGAYATPTKASGHILNKGNGKLLGDGAYRKGLNATKGAIYVVAGHGGTGVSQKGKHPLMVFVEKANGSCIVDVDRNVMTLKNLRYDGKITDSFTLVKGDALVVASPNGGETLKAGGTVSIRWKTFGTVSKVNLLYSADAGKSWKSIARAVTNSGSYSWKIPGLHGSQFRFKVEDASDPKNFDTSNANVSISIATDKTVIPFGSVWKYDDSGKDHKTAWRSVSFSDFLWKSGPAQLGYGDGDEKTKLKRPTPRRPSVYFRKVITLTQQVSAARLSVLFDDGILVYVNGKRVFSANATGRENYGDWASATSEDNEKASTELAVSTSGSPFVVGKNVIAVMVKQRSITSSDLSFDLSLSLSLLPIAPKLAALPTKEGKERQRLSFSLKLVRPTTLKVSYGIKNAPQGASLNPQTGAFSWTPASGMAGSYKLQFTVTDSLGRTHQQDVSLLIYQGSISEPTKEPTKETTKEPSPEPRKEPPTPDGGKAEPAVEPSPEPSAPDSTGPDKAPTDTSTPEPSQETVVKDVISTTDRGNNVGKEDTTTTPPNGCQCSQGSFSSTVLFSALFLLFGLKRRRSR
jgi:hypothetical protein